VERSGEAPSVPEIAAYFRYRSRTQAISCLWASKSAVSCAARAMGTAPSSCRVELCSDLACRKPSFKRQGRRGGSAA
jgi:hypothetical protein